MGKIVKLLVAPIIFVITLEFSWAGAQEPTTPVTLEGTLQAGEFMGPPNYGENPGTDRIEGSYYLQLPAPVSTQTKLASGLNKEAQTSYFVQLVIFDFEKTHPKSLLGKRVKIVGPLFEAHMGHHRTPVLIQVESLAEVQQWQW